MVPGFDPASPDFGRDPWPVYAAIRALPELPWLAGFEGHVAARFHDVSAIASDRRMAPTTERSVAGLTPRTGVGAAA